MRRRVTGATRRAIVAVAVLVGVLVGLLVVVVVSSIEHHRNAMRAGRANGVRYPTWTADNNENGPRGRSPFRLGPHHE
jgi:hypothetical protein